MLHRMFSRLFALYRSHLSEIWSVIIIILIAGALRFSFLSSSTVWNGDTARDFLVGRHLSLYHEPLHLGHSAYGLRIPSEKNLNDPYGMSHYPSYFFQIMGALWSVTGSALNLTIVGVIYQLAGLVVLYFGLRQVFGKIAAWCALAIIAASSTAVAHSLGVAINFAVPLFFLTLTTLITGVRLKKTWWLAVSALLCIFGCLIHYSFLLCFAWVVSASMLSLWRQRRYKAAVIFGGAISLAGAALFFALHLEVIQFYGFWPFVNSFRTQYGTAPTLEVARFQTGDLLLTRLKGIFFDWAIPLTALSVGLIGMTSSSEKKLRPFLIGPVGFAVSLIVLVATKSFSTFHKEQVIFFDYIFMILVGVSCGTIFEKSQKEIKIAITLIFGVMLFATSNFVFRHPPAMYTLSLPAAKAQAQELIEKSPYPLEDTEFYVSSYYSWDYETPTVVFWLEELSGKKLIKLTESYNNLSWEGPPKHHMIVSCQRFPTSPPNETASCQSFVQHYTTNGKYTLEKELFSNENYRAFLYTVH